MYQITSLTVIKWDMIKTLKMNQGR